ncbi:MAG: rfaG [Bacteroidetes bacterium]|nr:MAG: rfaG [Bacteroidota bacterium]
MLIVVNTRLLIHDRLDGIGRFTYESLSRITQKHPDDHFVFLFDRPIHEDFIFSENITAVKLFPPARRPWLFNIWFNWSVAGVLRDLKPDVFLSPDGFLPARTATPCLPVIHDLNFEHYPGDLPPKILRYYKKNFPQFARKGTRVATVSEFSKNDIAEKYGVDPSRIDVVYNGASAEFLPLTDEIARVVRKKYAQDAPYFLFVGSLHPRKNVTRLLQAFEIFRKNNDTNLKLLIVGERYWRNFDLNDALEKMIYKNEVIFTGRVSPDELHRIMGAAHALTYVPYFEGFGIPIVEAMACEVPVITSNITSMPEVAGEAALLVDPFSAASIADAMQKIAKDENLRSELIRKGNTQREKFSWDRTADLLWESIQKTCTGDSPNRPT